MTAKYDTEADQTGPSRPHSEHNAADDNGAYRKGEWVWQPTGGAPRRVWVPAADSAREER